MKKRIALILGIVLVVGLIWTGSAFAREVNEDGRPVAMETTEETTVEPTDEPTEAATPEPTEDPTPVPTGEPTDVPTGGPTEEPTDEPGAETTEEPEEAPVEEEVEDNPVCEGLVEHPVFSRIETQYEVKSEDLLIYFCEYDFGIGEIVHMFRTIARTEGSLTIEEILRMRTEDELGWGEIWQNAGLIGNGRHSEDAEETEAPEEAEEPEEMEGFARNQNREKFKHQTNNAGEDDSLENENKPDLAPGQDKDKSPGKPENPPGQEKDENPGKPGQDKDKKPGNPGNPPGKDKDKGHPGNGNRP